MTFCSSRARCTRCTRRMPLPPLRNRSTMSMSQPVGFCATQAIAPSSETLPPTTLTQVSSSRAPTRFSWMSALSSTTNTASCTGAQSVKFGVKALVGHSGGAAAGTIRMGSRIHVGANLPGPRLRALRCAKRRDPMDSPNVHATGNLLQLVERSAFIGFWQLDAKNRRLYWSEQLARLLGAPAGYAPEFDRALDHFAREHRAELEARMRACQEQGTPFDLEVQVETQHGRRLWVRCVGQPLRDESGAITGVEGLVQEIAPAGYGQGTLLRHT